VISPSQRPLPDNTRHSQETDIHVPGDLETVIPENRWAGHVERMGKRKCVYRVLVGKLEGKRQFGRPRRSWEDYIKMDRQEVGCKSMEWIELAQDRDRWRVLVHAVMKLRVP